jgi:hypothetical protein
MVMVAVKEASLSDADAGHVVATGMTIAPARGRRGRQGHETIQVLLNRAHSCSNFLILAQHLRALSVYNTYYILS